MDNSWTGELGIERVVVSVFLLERIRVYGFGMIYLTEFLNEKKQRIRKKDFIYSDELGERNGSVNGLFGSSRRGS